MERQTMQHRTPITRPSNSGKVTHRIPYTLIILIIPITLTRNIVNNAIRKRLSGSVANWGVQC